MKYKEMLGKPRTPVNLLNGTARGPLRGGAPPCIFLCFPLMFLYFPGKMSENPNKLLKEILYFLKFEPRVMGLCKPQIFPLPAKLFFRNENVRWGSGHQHGIYINMQHAHRRIQVYVCRVGFCRVCIRIYSQDDMCMYLHIFARSQVYLTGCLWILYEICCKFSYGQLGMWQNCAKLIGR